MARTCLLGVSLLLLSLATAQPAAARQSSEFTYTYDQLWRASIRLVAVDFRFPIGERDPEIGFFLFDYREGGRTYHGSMELVRTAGAHGTPQVRVTVQVPEMPSYVERHLLDRLQRKLSEDYGTPPPSRAAPARPPRGGAAEEEPTEDPPAEGDAEEDSPEAEDAAPNRRGAAAQETTRAAAR